MKKLLILGGIFAMFTFTSCKKDYTCDCTVFGDPISVPVQNAKKKDAESACDAAETTYKNGDPSASCTLN